MLDSGLFMLLDCTLFRNIVSRSSMKTVGSLTLPSVLQVLFSKEGLCSSGAVFAFGCDDASQHRPHPHFAH